MNTGTVKEQSVFVILLQFDNPAEIPAGMNEFYRKYAENIDEVISVVHYITAVQAPPTIARPGQPQVIPYFNFIITYTGAQIMNEQALPNGFGPMGKA